jgi:hypothetical protein
MSLASTMLRLLCIGSTKSLLIGSVTAALA